MDGFFTKKEIESKSRPGGKLYSCASCGLFRQATHAKMKPTGSFEKYILCIGSVNNELEDYKGKHWVGDGSSILRKELAKFDVDLYRDCLSINAVNCHPIEDDFNKDYAVAACRNTINLLIQEKQPSIVLLFGIDAVKSVIGARWQKDLKTIERWRGWVIPDQSLGTWICPVYHPLDLMKDRKEMFTIWQQDLERALSYIDKPFPKHKEPTIHYIKNLDPLNEIKTDRIAFDYETTGIKPHANGHKIVCASVAIDPNTVYTFLMPQKKKKRLPFITLLKNPMIGKMAHNMKFEDNWTVEILKTNVNNWEWDSMIAAHNLDNRPDISGLKFQTYVHFGIADYDSEINPYLKSGDKSSNALNKVEVLLGTKKEKLLLKYCALDSIYQYRLAMIQQDIINYDFLPF